MKKRIVATCLILVLAFTGCSKVKLSNSISDNSKVIDENKKEKTLSDTVRWFNATFSIITSKNGADLSLYGGYEKDNASNQSMMRDGLKDAWDVTDRKSADETLTWLLDEGHNKELLEEYKKNSLSSMSRNELKTSLSDSSYTDIDRAYFLGMYDAVDTYGKKAILAWDLCRGMQLSAWYYIAGYYTYDEAMESSLKIAKRLQKSYKSWDDMMQSYFYGFQYWNQDDMTDSDSESYQRKDIYQTLKTQKDGPFLVDWNLELQKDW